MSQHEGTKREGRRVEADRSVGWLRVVADGS